MAGEVLPQGVDQLEPATFGEGLQLDHLPRAVLVVTRGAENEQARRSGLGERCEQRAGRVVEPVQVLGHDDRPVPVGAGEDVATRGLGDLLLQDVPFRGDRPVPGAGRDADERCEQRKGGRRVEPDVGDLAGEALEALDRIGVGAIALRSSIRLRTGWNPAWTWKGEPRSSRTRCRRRTARRGTRPRGETCRRQRRPSAAPP